VQVLTKPTDPTQTRGQINQRYFSRLLHATEDCKLVKLADKLDNVRDAPNSPDLAKRRRTAAEARDFYLRLVRSLSDAQRREVILNLLEAEIEHLESQIGVV
jgi:(p)ppGpp synthase/HD superfamily hydrolase